MEMMGNKRLDLYPKASCSTSFTMPQVEFGEFEVHIGATGIVKVKVRRTIPQTLCDVAVISPSILFLSVCRSHAY